MEEKKPTGELGGPVAAAKSPGIFMTSDPNFLQGIKTLPANVGVKGGGSLSSAQVEAEKRTGGDRVRDLHVLIEKATDAELASFRAIVEKRVSSIPRFKFWRCPLCNWLAKLPFREGRDRQPCLRCNLRLLETGAWMIEMSKREAEQYEKDEADAFRRAVEYDKAQAARLKPVEEARLLSGDRKW